MTIWIDPPRSRKSDPDTSRKAEAQVVADGTVKTQCDLILRFMKGDRRRLTACEIASNMQRDEYVIDRYAVSRRLPEMESRGDVVRRDARRCSINGTLQATWEAA